MKAVDFKEANKTLTRPASMSDKDCGSLYVYNKAGQSISCWRMTWKERIAAVLFGKVWLWVRGGETQPPVALTCERTAFEEDDNV